MPAVFVPPEFSELSGEANAGNSLGRFRLVWELMMFRSIPFGSGMLRALVIAGGSLALVAEEPQFHRQTQISQLQPQQFLIGKWRGVGQVRRGSSQGAWQEKVEAIWELSKDHTGIRWTASDGKLWKSALLTAGSQAQSLLMRVTLPDDTQRDYRGRRDDERLVFESDPDGKQDVYRVTWTQLGDNRLTVLFERRGINQTFYQRMAEIGYQREGTRLAAVDGNGPECVVTGGLGTIPVSYEGQTYYVCCTGCRDAFNDDPKGILAAWAERRRQKPK